MVFPISSSSTPRSLLANLTLPLRSAPPHESTNLEDLLTRITNLVEKTHLNPGTIAEAGHLVKAFNTHGGASLHDGAQRALAVMGKAIVALQRCSDSARDNLEDCLTQAYPNMPHFDGLMQDVTEVIIHGQLTPPPIQELNAFLKRHYRKEIGNTSQGAVYLQYFKQWIAKHERKALGIPNDESRYLHESREFCENLLDRAKTSYRLERGKTFPVDCGAELSELKQQALILHEKRCVLIEEAYLMAEIEALFTSLRNTFGLSGLCAGPNNDLITHLHGVIDDWLQQRRRMLNEYDAENPLLLNLNVQLAEKFDWIDHNFPFSPQPETFECIEKVRSCPEQRERSAEHILEQLKITEKSCESDPECEQLLQGLAIEKRYYTLQLSENLIYHTLSKAHCMLRAERKLPPGVIEDLAQLAPMYCVISKFTRRFTNDYANKQTFWQAMARFPLVVLELMDNCLILFRQHEKEQSAQFASISNALNTLTDLKRFPNFLKKSLQQSAIPLIEQSQVLPDNPTLDAMRKWRNPSPSHQINKVKEGAKRIVASRHFRKKTPALKVTPDEQEEALLNHSPLSSDSSSHVSNTKQVELLESSEMKPFPFNYHFRVTRWQSARVPLDPHIFRNYSALSPLRQVKAIQLHNFPQLADHFWHRGLALPYRGAQSEVPMTSYVLPAELAIDGEKQRGCVVWTVDHRNLCYHRFFHIKPQSQFISKFVRRAFDTDDFPLTQNLASLENPIPNDEKSAGASEESVIIDSLLHCATILGSEGNSKVMLRLFLEKLVMG